MLGQDMVLGWDSLNLDTVEGKPVELPIVDFAIETLFVRKFVFVKGVTVNVQRAPITAWSPA